MKKEKGISIYKNDKLMNSIVEIENARKQIKAGVAASYAVKRMLLKIGG